MDLGLKGKLAIITGGARGIGRSIALAFAREGANIVLVDINAEAMDTTARDAQKLGVQVVSSNTDVTDYAAVETMIKDTVSRFGRVDALVCNTGVRYDKDGVPVTFQAFRESSLAAWHADIELVLFGTVNCCRAVVETMIENGGGHIVNIASPAGQIGIAGMGGYACGKAGVIALTRTLAVELAPQRINVNCVTPGFIATTGVELIEEQKKIDPQRYEYYKKIEKQWTEAIPLGGPGQPLDVANMVTYLASDTAGWITGQTVNVDGGQVIR